MLPHPGDNICRSKVESFPQSRKESSVSGDNGLDLLIRRMPGAWSKGTWPTCIWQTGVSKCLTPGSLHLSLSLQFMIFRNSYKVILAFKNSSQWRNQHQQLRHALCSFTRSEIWTHRPSKQWNLARSFLFNVFLSLFVLPTYMDCFVLCFVSLAL